MKNTNLPPFYVGQRVVAVRGGKMDIIKKGKEYTIKRLHKFSCGCWVVDVGVQNGSNGVHCGFHGLSYVIMDNNWISSTLFAPIESTFESISFKKVVEIESPLIGIN